MSLYLIDFVLPGLPPTTNSHGRSHWSVKARLARQWKEMVRIQVGINKPPVPLKKAKLELIRVSSQAPDSDGLVSSFKHVIDGLVDCGVLEDDKFMNIGMPTYGWEMGKIKGGFVKVRVEEI